ncbi:MAG: hypothetical protein JWL86_4365 [Rhizobium sp.]|nr:hypothetical protein [Rhizobium sp.]
MTELAVKSRIVKLMAYDRDRFRLRIEFRSGAIRLSPDVPPKSVSAFVTAEPPGFYHTGHIP